MYCRKMKESDIETGLRLCRAAKWNQLLRDWELFLRLSPDGCRVAVRDGRDAGTVATIRYEDRFAWVSMVLVDPAERRNGVGTMLLQEALEILSDLASVRLDATPAGHPIYLRLGFHDEYRLSRLEAESSGFPNLGDAPARRLAPGEIASISETDRTCFGASRGMLLEWLAAGAPEYAWIVERNRQIAGYVLGRHGYNFEHIGPMVASDFETAQALFRACVPAFNGRRVILDVPEHAREWRCWLESLGFVEQRPFIRMFRGSLEHPGLPEKIFAITGPEFG
jgi:GNAT superfamily N-acetyltransferase